MDRKLATQFDTTHANRFVEPVTDELRLCGGEGSPYSNKVLAILRFRRLRFRWMTNMSPEVAGTANPPGPVLLPRLLYPDGSAANDSTFLVKDLEKRYAGRSVIP